MTTTRTHLAHPAACAYCGFSTTDIVLISNHDCETNLRGGRCEDYPCCGHEAGDCNGQLYGSDEAIKADAMKHSNCDHAAGVYDCEDLDEDED
jgi:hypothetical protein